VPLCAGIFDKFADAFSKAVQSMQVGDGFSEGVAQVGVVACFSLCRISICVKLVWYSMFPRFSSF